MRSTAVFSRFSFGISLIISFTVNEGMFPASKTPFLSVISPRHAVTGNSFILTFSEISAYSAPSTIVRLANLNSKKIKIAAVMTKS